MRRFCLLPIPLFAACFTAELDPDAAGAFACSDAPGEACPGELQCVNNRCEAGAPPLVEVRNPEEEQAFLVGDAPPDSMREIQVIFGGTLDIVDPDETEENVFGQGHLEVFVDGMSVATIEAGALSGGIPFTIRIPNRIGAHRIGVQALRNDGSRYDNAEAFARRLFWIDDEVTPLVGMRNPWPGTSFTLDAQVVAFDVAVRNFTLRPAMPSGVPEEKVGHVHVYYNVPIATCVRDINCDGTYITTVTSPMPSEATIPDSAAGPATVSVALRNINHSLFEFDVDGIEGPIEPVIVTDTIPIVRE